MEILVCNSAGLCYGASRAYNKTQQAIQSNKNVVMFHEVLHNRNLVQKLLDKGCIIVNSISQTKNKTVVLRAHGETKQNYYFLEKNNIPYIDTICPNVLNLRKIAIAKQEQGFKIIVYGKKIDGVFHDEILSLFSFLDDPILITDVKDIDKIKFYSNQKYFLLSQTTMNDKLFYQIASAIDKISNKQKFPFEFKNTICNHTNQNLINSKDLINKCDIGVVIGYSNSNNTVELYNQLKVLKPTILSSDINQIIKFVKDYALDHNIEIKNLTIGIFAGASTLKEDIVNIKKQLQQL